MKINKPHNKSLQSGRSDMLFMPDIHTKKLKDLIDIPDDFSSETVEIIVLPMLSAVTEKSI